MTFREIQDQTIRRFKATLRTDLKEWILAAYDEVWGLEEWTFRYATATVTATAGTRELAGMPADIGTPILLQNTDGDEIAYQASTDFLRNWQGDTNLGDPGFWTRINDTYLLGPTPDSTAQDWQLYYERATGHYPSTTMAETTTLPDATLTVTTTAELPTAGTVLIGKAGRPVAYTGKTSSTLTGCTGPAGTVLTTGDVVAGTVAQSGPLSADTDVPLLPAETHMLLVFGAQEFGQALESDPTAPSSAQQRLRILDAMRRRYLTKARLSVTQWPADQGW
jgi:hypothetical protein